MCCQVEVSASAWSRVRRSPTDCGVSECDRVAPTTEKNNPYTTLTDRWDFRRLRHLDFLEDRHIKVVKLTALLTGRLYLSRYTPDTSFC